jgi:hypothetical protein
MNRFTGWTDVDLSEKDVAEPRYVASPFKAGNPSLAAFPMEQSRPCNVYLGGRAAATGPDRVEFREREDRSHSVQA